MSYSNGVISAPVSVSDVKNAVVLLDTSNIGVGALTDRADWFKMSTDKLTPVQVSDIAELLSAYKQDSAHANWKLNSGKCLGNFIGYDISKVNANALECGSSWTYGEALTISLTNAVLDGETAIAIASYFSSSVYFGVAIVDSSNNVVKVAGADMAFSLLSTSGILPSVSFAKNSVAVGTYKAVPFLSHKKSATSLPTVMYAFPPLQPQSLEVKSSTVKTEWSISANTTSETSASVTVTNKTSASGTITVEFSYYKYTTSGSLLVPYSTSSAYTIAAGGSKTFTIDIRQQETSTGALQAVYCGIAYVYMGSSLEAQCGVDMWTGSTEMSEDGGAAVASEESDTSSEKEVSEEENV